MKFLQPSDISKIIYKDKDKVRNKITTDYYTLTEVSQHDSATDLWMIIDGKVYDITGFIDDHPGGAEVLFDCAGLDATEVFHEVGHSQDSIKMLQPLLKGVVRKDDNSHLHSHNQTSSGKVKTDGKRNDIYDKGNDNNKSIKAEEDYRTSYGGKGSYATDIKQRDGSFSSLKIISRNISIGESQYWRQKIKKRRKLKDKHLGPLLGLLAVVAFFSYLYIERLKWS